MGLSYLLRLAGISHIHARILQSVPEVKRWPTTHHEGKRGDSQQCFLKTIARRRVEVFQLPLPYFKMNQRAFTFAVLDGKRYFCRGAITIEGCCNLRPLASTVIRWRVE